MDPIILKPRNLFASIRSLILTKLDPLEKLRMRHMKRSGQLMSINDLVSKFEGSTFFAFATGGSLSKIKGLEQVKDHNVLMLTTAPIHFFRMYGVMPNLWLIHNPSSVRMACNAIESYNLKGKIDFSNTFILVPSNSSKSKIKFSDNRMRQLRKTVGKTNYALYEEKVYLRTETASDFDSGNAVPKNYLRRAIEPIELMNGSSVEAVILPFLAFLGVSEIYFGGVDHRDTGHFWNHNDPWQTEHGSPKTFDDRELITASGLAAIKQAKSKEISIYRLEPTMTALTHYEHIEFENALSRSSKRL